MILFHSNDRQKRTRQKKRCKTPLFHLRKFQIISTHIGRWPHFSLFFFLYVLLSLSNKEESNLFLLHHSLIISIKRYTSIIIIIFSFLSPHAHAHPINYFYDLFLNLSLVKYIVYIFNLFIFKYDINFSSTFYYLSLSNKEESNIFFSCISLSSNQLKDTFLLLLFSLFLLHMARAHPINYFFNLFKIDHFITTEQANFSV